MTRHSSSGNPTKSRQPQRKSGAASPAPFPSSAQAVGPFALWSQWASLAESAALAQSAQVKQWRMAMDTLEAGLRAQKAAADLGLRQAQMMKDWMALWGIK